MTRVRKSVVSLGVALAAAGGLLVAPGTAAAAPSWGPCPQLFGASRETVCTTITVPADYANPGGRKIDVLVSKLPATGPKRGVLVGNPGGPSGDGVSMFTQLPMPAAVRAQYDLVAVQPRGLPGAGALDCTERFVIGAELRAACERTLPGYAATITTANTARDVESARKALGLGDRLNLYGLSYGTTLFSTYATMYPQHVDRLILDSAVDPEMLWNDLLAAQTPHYKKRVNAMFAWIAANDRVFHLGTTPLAVYRKWSARVEQEAGVPPSLAAPPARVGDVPPGLRAIARQYVDAVNLTADARARLENAVATVATGRIQATSSLYAVTRQVAPHRNAWYAVAELIITPQSPPPPTAELQRAFRIAGQMQNTVLCNENRVAPDPLLLPAATISELLGDAFEAPGLSYKSGAACAGVPSRPLPMPANRGLPVRPLLINSLGDPQTPYAGAKVLARLMNAHVITVGGGDHGQAFRGNAPLDAAIVEYLATGRTSVTSVPEAPIPAPRG